MTEVSDREDIPTKLATLRSILEAATAVMADLIGAGGPLFERFARVYTRMPADDREPIVSVLEREVDGRLMADTVADTVTGVRLAPNPHARLYLHVIDGDAPLDREEMVQAVVRAMAMRRALQTIGPAWEEIAVEALRRLSPPERAQVADFCRHMVALVDSAEQSPAGMSAEG